MLESLKTKLAGLKGSPRLLILLAPFALMAPVWLTGRAMYWGTPSTQFIPWWWQAWQTLRAGDLPLWNALAGMGAPLLANYQSALLYPPTWIYFVLAAIGGLLLMAWGQALLVALHLAWAGWGMGLLIRRLGKSDLAQTVGGLAFGLSGYLVARAHFLSINAAVAWLPWILLLSYELILDPRNKRTLLKLALVLAMQWLAGHAQIAWYTVILAFVWIFFWSWKKGGLPNLGSSVLVFAIGGLLAFCLSAAQLLPTAEYLANSQRSAQVDFAQAATYSFWPWRLTGLVAPNFFGNPSHGDYWGYGNFWEDAIYIGFLPFVLALAAVWWSIKKRENKPLLVFLIAIAFISFVLALGNRTPLFKWLFHNVPTFSLFQSPTRISIWMVFAFALLSALAIDYWKRPSGRAMYWSRLAVAAAVAILLGAGVGWLFAQQGLIRAHQSFFSAMLTMGLFALAAAWLHLRSPVMDGEKRSRWPWLVSGLITLDLLVAGWGLNPGTNLELYKQDSELSVTWKEQLAGGRVFISAVDEYELRYQHFFRFGNFYIAEPREIRNSLLPDTFLLDGISSANNYDPLMPSRYKEFMDMWNSADAKTQEVLLARMNVTLVERFDPGTDSDASFAPVVASPRARWSSCAISVGDEEDALLMLSGNIDPGTVIIEGSVGQWNCESGGEASPQITGGNANRVEITVNSPQPGWLLLADTYYPGWRVYVNGKETTIYPSDGMFRGVHLEAGQSQVQFVYGPMLFFVGAGISVVAWLFLIVLWRRNPVQ